VIRVLLCKREYTNTAIASSSLVSVKTNTSNGRHVGRCRSKALIYINAIHSHVKYRVAVAFRDVLHRLRVKEDCDYAMVKANTKFAFSYTRRQSD
jgi:hypothetical protein